MAPSVGLPLHGTCRARFSRTSSLIALKQGDLFPIRVEPSISPIPAGDHNDRSLCHSDALGTVGRAWPLLRADRVGTSLPAQAVDCTGLVGPELRVPVGITLPSGDPTRRIPTRPIARPIRQVWRPCSGADRVRLFAHSDPLASHQQMTIVGKTHAATLPQVPGRVGQPRP